MVFNETLLYKHDASVEAIQSVCGREAVLVRGCCFLLKVLEDVDSDLGELLGRLRVGLLGQDNVMNVLSRISTFVCKYAESMPGMSKSRVVESVQSPG